MKNLSILLPITALLYLAGCAANPKVSIADLIGTYEISSTLAKGTLALKSDGAYQQNLTLKTGVARATSGTWKFYNNGDNRIELSNFLSVDDAGGTIAPRFSKASYNASIESASHTIDIVVNGDTNEFYRRTK